MVRVAIDIARVGPLHLSWTPERDVVLFATTVTDPASYKVLMIVRLDHQPTPADLAAAEGLGGRITSVRNSAAIGYSVELEDAMVPRLRALPGVISASMSTWGCIV